MKITIDIDPEDVAEVLKGKSAALARVLDAIEVGLQAERLPTSERDREIIADLRRWPLKTLLPMKQYRRDRYGETGYLIPTDRTVVRQRIGEDRYDTVTEMLDAGWRVD